MRYKISQAVQPGLAHLKKGEPCQDKALLIRCRDVFCATLADGAGSQKYSEYGAECVTSCVAETVCADFEYLWALDDRQLARVLIDDCLGVLSQMVLPFDELGCTLHFFAGHRDGRYISGHLGDGVQILVDGPEERLSVFSAPENGERHNETYFVTSFNAEGHLRVRKGRLQGAGALLMMSDGPEACLYNRADCVPAEACRTMARWLHEEEERAVSDALKKHLEFTFAQYSADDMSICIVAWDEDGSPDSKREGKEGGQA